MEPELALAAPLVPRSTVGGWRAFARRAFRAWGHGQVEARLRAGLDGVHVHGLGHLREAAARGPVIVAANHVCWWDGLVLVQLNHALTARGMVLMRADQLRRFSFFRSFGALPLDTARPNQARRDLQAAADRLRGPGDVLWIFPQGEHTPVERRPLGFKPGVALLARLSGAPVVPVALRYPWAQAPRPAAAVRVGPAIPPGRRLLPALEHAVAALLDDALTEGPAGTPLVPPLRRPDRASPALAWLHDRLLGGGDG
ncbi:MAG: 1-acyl-sn-glycerol-3-phosphate acyltransferase [Alphaproteobacteria bacterium]|nr:1-acyl-sn-glycerol-3-phosphate acyltransferase [Alphaproteobacteria bacterium]